ncbi:MAG: hypothetical protein P4M01_03440 [Acidobacteriota bacterium]|nr:hypothetical protein [Acidobacteriota bacterium]
MPITKYEGQTITGKTLVIEEYLLVNCVLRQCDVFYSGGDFEWINTTFDNCSIHFRGPALKTVQFEQALGMLKQPQMPPTAQKSTSGKMN